MNPWKKRLQERNGQGLTEYIIIVTLIAVFTMKAVQYFGGTIRKMYGQVSAELQDKKPGKIDFGELGDAEEIHRDRSIGDFDD